MKRLDAMFGMRFGGMGTVGCTRKVGLRGGTWFLDWMGDIGRVEVGGRGLSRVSRG